MDDVISRQAAIDALEESKKQYFDRRVIIGKMQDIINNLPSAQPEVQQDGTLNITVNTDISQIRRVLVSQEGTQYGNMYYADAEPYKEKDNERA